jgi:hypothetical protein
MELFLVPHSKDLSTDWIKRYPETAPDAILSECRQWEFARQIKSQALQPSPSMSSGTKIISLS